MTHTIAVVGMACHYPDATSPVELWENALAGRKAFRRIPAERLSLQDYLATDADASDSTYSTQAAVIRDYQFDRGRFRVAGSTFRAADLTHWLALDVADRALADAGCPAAEGLPRESAGVLVGNSLTGEFSRANVLRLRWPYVRRTLDAALARREWTDRQRAEILAEIEQNYKAPFPPVGDESLAGGLSNTIAGRICNHFDLGGGGYTVDGACSSSLLAIANSCSALAAGDLDVALAGGVDLSLDPFELVGFAKVGALARDTMRIYDARSAGFWPGEGCGFVVLMRWEDAVAQNRRVYAVVKGWGISSDGKGGLTRPEVEGQKRALQRAYRRAGFGIDTVTYFEGHGTGTAVGDATELRTLSEARRERDPQAAPAVIGSIKAIIGHTKAAAGVAGFLKTTMALNSQVLPPSVGMEQPHAELCGSRPALECLSQGTVWPNDRPLRAGVNAMGFGGINAHLVMEGIGERRRSRLDLPTRRLISTPQDAELFLFRAETEDGLRRQLVRIADYAERIALCELGDLAAQLDRSLGVGAHRGAIVAASPDELAAGITTLQTWLTEGVSQQVDDRGRVLLGCRVNSPTIGFLFPGQGFPAHRDGGAWRRRFEQVAEIYSRSNVPTAGDGTRTDVAQPAIILASLVGLHMMDWLGIRAAVAIGHSLGELAAYHWAGAFDQYALLRLATARGKAMAASAGPRGTMASVCAKAEVVRRLIGDLPVVLAGLNAPNQTVISGETAAIEVVVQRAQAEGLGATNLQVSHAFHSPLIADSASAISAAVDREAFAPLSRPIVSTVTGGYLHTNDHLGDLLQRQITAPVRFMKAMRSVREPVDLWIEVGPGHVLSRLATQSTTTPIVSLDVGSETLAELLQTAGRLFVLGAPLEHRVLFDDRFFRPFELGWNPSFFANPCEMVRGDARPDSKPDRDTLDANRGNTRLPMAGLATPGGNVPSEREDISPKEVVRKLVAERAELPLESVRDSDRFLIDLHLSSIAVGQLVADAAGVLNLPAPRSPTDYANATVETLATALAELGATGAAESVADEAGTAPGVDTWIRLFTVELIEQRLPRYRSQAASGHWTLFAADGDPLGPDLLRELTASVPGHGVAVCLPAQRDASHLHLMLRGVQAAFDSPPDSRFVLVERGWQSAALARTLHLEVPGITTCVVNVPPDHPQAANWITAEVRSARGYCEVHYDGHGVRRIPVLRASPILCDGGVLPLSAKDVLLVTGGGKGIASECALALARATGVRLGLLGRSVPSNDEELSTNLQRMRGAGVQQAYLSVDVTDAGAVQAAVREIEDRFGPITAFLHGAGANRPQPLNTLDVPAFLRTLNPKVAGAHHVLAAIDPDQLRLFVSFGSIIARTGMRGEADYGVANEWLRQLTEQWQAEHPHCRCRAIEWSVWSGAGMGERLGRIDALKAQGITPIGVDEGVRLIKSLIASPPPASSVIVTGRFGDPPTVKLDRPDLPLFRFLERPQVYLPGVELVVDADLSHETDLYLQDHVYQGTSLLPAVMGLEAMAQAVMAVTGSLDRPSFEEVRFDRPVAIPTGARTTIRLAALVRAPDRIEVVLRSEATRFQVNHFRAICRLNAHSASLDDENGTEQEPANMPPLPIEPDRDLYGDLLFHRGRFRRVTGYRRLRATECVAELSDGDDHTWFSDYLPGKLVLGNPAVRDAAIHAIQACIPHGTILPTGVDRLVLGPEPVLDTCFVHARERSHDGDTFVYDVDVLTPTGRRCEWWEGLRLKRVGQQGRDRTWAEPLLGPYLERRIAELVPGAGVSIALQENGEDGRRSSDAALPGATATAVAGAVAVAGAMGGPNGDATAVDGHGHGSRSRSTSDRAILSALGARAVIHRRVDGKPEVSVDADVAVAHAGRLTMAMAGPGPLACDLEPVAQRPPAVWRRMLGSVRFSLAETIRDQSDGDISRSGTRMWTVIECLKKAGRDIDTPITLGEPAEDRWVLVAAGDLVIATWIATIRNVSTDVALAFLIERHASQ